MKFIKEQGAPDIPLKIMEAQEEGNLVVFCGAGISSKLGLKGISGLTDQIYAELSTRPHDNEKEAEEQNNYDLMLNLLEQRVGKELFRPALIKALTPDPSTIDLSTHEVILEISKIKEGKFRLVTTNPDQGFRMAAPNALWHAADALPIPKADKWASIVHLHGLDDENDPYGNHLVFTTSDFGKAYLSEGWATRFILELFRNFTVLFIGYSLNDPIFRYITDSIATEIQLNPKSFKQPYIITRSTQESPQIEFEQWSMRGIEPIFYSGDHSLLHDTLKKWADHICEGLTSKEAIINLYGRENPIGMNDGDVNKVIETLHDKRGYPARVFNDLIPTAPIEWLPILDERGLLSFHAENVLIAPVNHGNSFVSPPENIFYLWEWLCKHLESNELIHWVIDKGLVLHPILKEIIRRVIEGDAPPKEPFLKFWRVVISNHVLQNKGDEYIDLPAMIKTKEDFVINPLISLLEPQFKFSRSLLVEGWWAEEKALYDIEVTIRLSDWSYEKLLESNHYPQEGYADLLPEVTSALKRALYFWSLFNKAEEFYDLSYIDLPSISPHPQNERFKSWSLLIEICRDLWEFAQKDNPTHARAILDLWKTIKYPTFRRLVFHAYTVSGTENPDEALAYLLENDGRWLWDNGVQREKFRLLSFLWPKLSKESAESLISNILAGPLRSMYPDNLDNITWKYSSDRMTYLLLAKLESFEQKLFPLAKDRLNILSKEYPDWSIADNESDEFVRWSETYWGNKVDITVKELFEMPISKLVTKLQENCPEYYKGRLEIFQTGAKELEHYQTVVEVLKYLKNQAIQGKEIWKSALTGLAESPTPSWLDVALLLSELDPLILSEFSWAVAWWVRKSSKLIEPNSTDEQYFWVIANNLLSISHPLPAAIDSKVYNVAINNPIGIITESILSRLESRKLKKDEGIPKETFLNSLNLLLGEKQDSNLLGRVILASQLMYLYTIDPTWIKNNLLPKLNWANSQEAAYLWQGYLSNPQITLELALELKEFVLVTLAKDDLPADKLEQLHRLFARMCLVSPELYSTTEKQDGLKKIGVLGLRNIATFIWQVVAHNSEKENYWRNRIKPFISKTWPKDKKFVDSEISRLLTLMSIEIATSFPEVRTSIAVFLKPFPNQFCFLHNLNTKEALISLHPTDVAKLLSQIFIGEYNSGEVELLKSIFEKIYLAKPMLRHDPDLKNINDYLVMHYNL